MKIGGRELELAGGIDRPREVAAATGRAVATPSIAAIASALLGLALLLTFATQLAFWLSYDIGDLAKHLLPSYLILSIWLGLGVATVLALVGLAWQRASHRTVDSRVVYARGLATTAVVLVFGWLALLPNGSAALPVALGQEPVDYQATLGYHVPRNLTESETAARQTVSALPANAVIFTEWREHFTLGYVAEFQRVATTS